MTGYRHNSLLIAALVSLLGGASCGLPAGPDPANRGDGAASVVPADPDGVSSVDASGESWMPNNVGPAKGLGRRPNNYTCLAPKPPVTTANVADVRVFRSVPDFVTPIALVQAPGDPTQWYLAERDGRVYRFDNVESPAGATLFIDLTGSVDSTIGEGGLLGIAFHPDYSSNRKVYLSYTATGPDASSPLTSRLSEFTSNDGGLTLDPATEVVVLSLDQPFDYHNGGHIVFGPDGYLYMGFGDGGGDAMLYGHRSQNTRNLFGSVLRLDVDGGTPYAIPAGNPFAGNPLCDISTGAADAAESCPEIYAWGFRNPWRFSFDRATGDLWLGDVGQHDWEEVNIVQTGGNYGWNILEGNACFNPPTGCDTAGLVAPVITYDHSIGASITGGFIYRGSEIPELIGRYFFVDFVTRVIFASTSDSEGNYGYEILYNSNLSLSSLSEDENGELYGLRYGNGRIHKFIQAGGAANNTIADKLSDTGCVDPGDPTRVAEGLIPYQTAATFWSDGATKERYYAIPDTSTIDVAPDGDWLFPVGTVLLKHFRLGGDFIETRLFMRHTNGEWAGYTYEWDESQTDATRVVGGKTRDIDGQEWIYPSEPQCVACHTEAASSSLGIEHAQLNKSILYPSTGVKANQLLTAASIGMLTDPLPDSPANLPALVDPGDISKPLDARVRAYLHVNCSGCHRPLGPTPSNMDLRFDTPWADMNVCDVPPTQGSLGIEDARIVAPGDASRSVLVSRIDRRDVYAMPPIASNLVDAGGVDLLTTWIDGLSACP